MIIQGSGRGYNKEHLDRYINLMLIIIVTASNKCLL